MVEGVRDFGSVQFNPAGLGSDGRGIVVPNKGRGLHGDVVLRLSSQATGGLLRRYVHPVQAVQPL
jgi:hypothetical protein